MRENTLPVKEIHVRFQPALDKKHSHPGCNLQGVAHIRGWHSVDTIPFIQETQYQCMFVYTHIVVIDGIQEEIQLSPPPP